jgi:hypothetical protein
VSACELFAYLPSRGREAQSYASLLWSSAEVEKLEKAEDSLEVNVKSQLALTLLMCLGHARFLSRFMMSHLPSNQSPHQQATKARETNKSDHISGQKESSA